MSNSNSNSKPKRDRNVTRGGIDRSNSDDTSGVYVYPDDVPAKGLWDYLTSGGGEG